MSDDRLERECCERECMKDCRDKCFEECYCEKDDNNCIHIILILVVLYLLLSCNNGKGGLLGGLF